MTTPTTPLEPLVSDERIAERFRTVDSIAPNTDEISFLVAAEWVRDIYEAERSKEREVMREAAELLPKLAAHNAEDKLAKTALLSKLNERINNKDA